MPYEQKVQELTCAIKRYKKACQSSWPQPSDYTQLIDAQYELRALTHPSPARQLAG